MKKLLFAVSALAALSLLAPSTGLAQYPNQLGIYANTDGTGTGLQEVAMFATVPAYVVVSNPYNTNLEMPIAGIRAVEWGLVAPANVTVLGLDFPVDNVNVGTTTNVIVGFGTPIAVVDGIAVVGTYSLLYTSTDASPAEILVSTTTPVSIPGTMALQDASDELLYSLYPSSGDFANPVFGINTGDDPLATDVLTIDAVKALYR